MVPLGSRTLVMGVLNVTPDSFSDGGRYLDPEAAFARACEMVEEGADLLDIGAESSRPGAEPIGEEEEGQRLLPVVRAVCRNVKVPVSIDTTKAAVARRALDLGAAIINDIKKERGCLAGGTGSCPRRRAYERQFLGMPAMVAPVQPRFLADVD